MFALAPPLIVNERNILEEVELGVMLKLKPVISIKLPVLFDENVSVLLVETTCITLPIVEALKEDVAILPDGIVPVKKFAASILLNAIIKLLLICVQKKMNQMILLLHFD